MSAPPSAVDSGLEHDDGTLDLCDLPEGQPIGYGEETLRVDRRGSDGVREERTRRWCRDEGKRQVGVLSSDILSDTEESFRRVLSSRRLQ